MTQGPTTVEGLVADIAERVRPAVPDMPPAEFEQLVRRMAQLELKYRLREQVTSWQQVTPSYGVPAVAPPP